MIPLPPNEVERLEELAALDLAGAPMSGVFDIICGLACALFQVPSSMVSLVDAHDQWLKAKRGFALDTTSRDISFCTYTILGTDPLVVEDARRDPRFRENPLVTGPTGVRFYAGVPLVVGNGAAVGAFCVLDTAPRTFTVAQLAQLRSLADLVVTHLNTRKAERRATEIAVSYRLLADHCRDVIVRGDAAGLNRYVSPAAAQVLGHAPTDLIGHDSLKILHPEDRARVEQLVRDVLHGGIQNAVGQYRCRHADGHYIWVEANLAALVDETTGQPNGYVAALRNIDDRRRAEDALRISEERMGLAILNGSDGFWDWDARTKRLWFSDQLLEKLGYITDEVRANLPMWLSLIHPDDLAEVRRRFIGHLAARTDAYECEHRLRHRDGDYSWFLVRGKVTSRDDDGRALRVLGTILDISARKEAERRIEYLATHDTLTGLANRFAFHERLTERLERPERVTPCAILLVDLNRFKVVNDTLGHHLGDLVLQEAARRLRSCVDEGDLVARLGGDEFAILMAEADGLRAAALAERLIERFADPMTVGDKTIDLGLSVGVSLAPLDGEDDLSLLRRADLALYRAKREARGSFSFFEPSMDHAIEERFQLSHELRHAIEREELEVVYQPIVCALSHRLRCAEALLRWRRGGLEVPPAVFIPLAEECGLIARLGQFVLEQACHEAALWAPDIRVAVNVSAGQLVRPDFVETVSRILTQSHLVPERLELEITESVLMRNDGACRANYERLRAMGVRVSLDDFGTGYSSLSYLRQFRFDKIKIDGSFVRELDDPRVMTIVRAILEIGRGLDATITAEGVETQEQLRALQREGCAEVQGFLFSRPLSAGQFTSFRLRDMGA